MTIRPKSIKIRAGKATDRSGTGPGKVFALVAGAAVLAASFATPTRADVLNIAFGDTYTILSSDLIVLTSDSSNEGTLLLEGQLNNESTLDNSGTLINVFGSRLENHGTLDNGGTLNNAGTLNNLDRLWNVARLNNRGTLVNSGTLQNDGTLENFDTLVNGDTLVNYDTLENYGTLNNQRDSLLENKGTLNNHIGSTLNNNLGSTLVNLGTLDNSGRLYNESELTNFVTLINRDTLVNFDTLVNHRSLINDTDGTLSNGGRLDNGGTLDNRGTLDNHANGRLNNGGTLDNRGTLNNYTDGRLSNGGTLNNLGTLDNSGTLNSNGTLNNDGTLYNSGTLNNNSGGALNNDGGTLNNSGQLFLMPDAGAVVLGGVVVNNGFIQVQGSDGTTGGTLTFTGDLSGSGQVDADLVQISGSLNAGNSAGLMTFNSDVEWMSGSSIVIELGGYDRGVSYDSFNISGDLVFDLGVTLDILTLGAFDPVAGDWFDLAYVTREIIGLFDVVPTGWSLSVASPFKNGRFKHALRLHYDGAGDVSEAGSSDVPEPGMLVLFGFGLFGMAVIGRRRTVGQARVIPRPYRYRQAGH